MESNRMQDDGEPAPARQGVAGRETATLLVSPVPSAAVPVKSSEASPYQILSEIGAGGMSTVFLARDAKLGRFVAIKRLRESFLADPAMRERFSLEARLIASLNHIYIVKLYDFDVNGPDPQIVMEYVAGPGKPPAPDWPAPSLNLEQKVESSGAPLTLRVAVVLLRKLCAAIDYAHRRGVIHRDLKPSNILLDEHGEPRIVDFGIARHAMAPEARLTVAGTRMLSLGYAAPEQEVDPSLADEKADVYSLGGILYFCLTGENPRFFRDSRVPDSIRPILVKAMEQDPQQRWPSVRDFSDVLTQSAGDFLSPLTDPGMWRCKWCGAMNPVASRYCTHCNWDGMERCPECSGETRLGVRFCGQCSTDIKAFEDIRALLSRLREFRRQKDFGRLKDAADGAARFQPRGPRGQELIQEIRELEETAAWALKRKDELTQAIAADLDRQNYEEIRERLNEYGVLDDGPEYRELRNVLPWRIAEGNIVALRKDLGLARQLMRERNPEEAGRRLADIENRLLSLQHLESQFPSLKGVLTPSADPAGEARTYAKAVTGLLEDVAALKSELEAGRRAYDQNLAAATVALGKRKHEECLRLCKAMRNVFPDSPDAAALEKKALEQLNQVERLLTRAGEALRKRDIEQAERTVRDVLERLKPDSVAAGDLLTRILRVRRKRALAVRVAAGVAVAAFYVLSIGPVVHYALNRPAPSLTTMETLRLLYAPVYWLHAHTPLRAGLENYAGQWGEPGLFNTR